MTTIHGPPSYDEAGQLHFTDGEDIPIVILCYVQDKPIPGYENFVLISNNTLVDLKADINYQARVSKETGILPMKRTNLEPYHYLDHQSNNDNNDIKLHNECHMSEIQLQTLLDNTQTKTGSEQEMDMIVKDGTRISKYDVRAIKIGPYLLNLRLGYISLINVILVKTVYSQPKTVRLEYSHSIRTTRTVWSYKISTQLVRNPNLYQR